MLLALLQPIEADTLPPLGAALLRLEQGDTARAIAELAVGRVGSAAAKGGAELRLLAGRLAAAKGDPDAGRAALPRGRVEGGAGHRAGGGARAGGAACSPRQRGADAVTQLEHLILTYPESALVPQARRALDLARGAVPRHEAPGVRRTDVRGARSR